MAAKKRAGFAGNRWLIVDLLAVTIERAGYSGDSCLGVGLLVAAKERPGS